MSIPYICGRCRQDIRVWRRVFHKFQFNTDNIHGASRPLSETLSWNNRKLFQHRALLTATARSPLTRTKHVSEDDDDGHLQGVFQSITRSSGRPSQSQPGQASSSQVSGGPTEDQNNERDGALPVRLAKENALLHRLNRAMTMRNASIAELAWGEFERWYAVKTKEISEADTSIAHQDSPSRVPGGSVGVEAHGQEAETPWTDIPSAKLYQKYLTVFMSLRRPDRASQVWKHMVQQAGLTPNAAFWNALLTGCRGARDTVMLEEIWNRLLNSGIKPDAVCWSTRIHALIVCGKCSEGIEALKSMGNGWRRAAEEVVLSKKRKEGHEDVSLSEMGDVGDIVKPTIETINGVLLALLRTQQIGLTQSMLNWAETLGIQPDLTTYNTLLRYTIREDSLESALEIFKTMEAAGVQPDIYTFTAILDGYFRHHTSSSSPQGQDALVQTLFTEMEAAGIPPTVYTYGIMIDNLLSPTKQDDPTSQSDNFSAVQAVLNHMRSKNVQPSALINTLLIRYHFSRDPPDIPSVEAVWDRVRSHPADGVVTDNIFYERLLDGYVRAAEVEPMMRVYRHMTRYAGGCVLRWDTMREMLRLLVNGNRYLDALRVVREIERKGGLFRQGCRGSSESEGRFWNSVLALRRL
ncbi:MAG: hypothetical protein M1816_001985 [Peltula sp. TS41687]|nr:MAG: hypothetical protein M1816_001985 [Peltula sp. TS41687]